MNVIQDWSVLDVIQDWSILDVIQDWSVQDKGTWYNQWLNVLFLRRPQKMINIEFFENICSPAATVRIS